MSYKQVADLYENDIDRELIATLTGKTIDAVNLICDNEDIESRMSGEGYKRFIERQEDLKARGKIFETNTVLDFVHKTIRPVASLIEEYKVTHAKGMEAKQMAQYDAFNMALSAVRVMIGLSQKNGKQLKFTTAAINVMEAIDVNIEKTKAVKCGRVVLEMVLLHTDDLFEKVLETDGKNQVYVINATDEFYKWEAEHTEELAEMSVMFRPMVVPPRPWDGLQSGGYHRETLKRSFIRNRKKLPLSSYGTKAIPKVYQAVNKIQATPFAVNQFVLDTALALQERITAGDKTLYHKKFIQEEPQAPHDRYARDIREAIEKDQEYLGLNKDEFNVALEKDAYDTDTGKRKPKNKLITFGKWIRSCLLKVVDGQAYDAKMRLEANRFDLVQLLKFKKKLTSVKSKNRVIVTALLVASDYRKYTQIFFPHNLDWRGRIYPMTAGLTTQGVGLQKALLKFDKGLPIGREVALQYLLAHTANCFGLDKAPWDERIQWTLDNREYIQKVAASPVETYDDWKDTDTPWLFIAACNAMASYYRDGLDACIDIPIPVDGTCNGAQHYAAMTRDDHGAYQVNVKPNGTKGLQDRLNKLRGNND